MKIATPLALAGVVTLWAGAPAADESMPKVIDGYCAACHDGRSRSASGAILEHLDAAEIVTKPDLWARAYRQLQAGAMPPFGSTRPDLDTVDGLLKLVERGLDVSSRTTPTTDSRKIATTLAAMVWNAAPDSSLRGDAEHDRLKDRTTLEGDVRRMLADERGRAFVRRFFWPWLQLDTLEKADPDAKYFPDYRPSLRESMAKETELFLLSQLREDRDPVELWTADYTFLDEQLARHYGVPNVTGAQFRRVDSTPERAGLLGQGSVLMVTSRHQHGVDAAYTSPATRAKWVRLHFLGASLPNGFPGAEPVKPELPITPQTRALPATPCVNCHRSFFPLGYALEHFDPIGRWRERDQIGPVDASGAFVDGTPMNGVVEMRQVLLRRQNAFRTTIAEALLVYASTGSSKLNAGTATTLVRARRILRDNPTPRWSALIAGVVTASTED